MSRPRIVCLCGSTKFGDEYARENLKFTLRGWIVLSVGSMTQSDGEPQLEVETKARLDELHLRKIDLADSVFVINLDGYIGDSTSAEIMYAIAQGKSLDFLEMSRGREWLQARFKEMQDAYLPEPMEVPE